MRRLSSVAVALRRATIAGSLPACATPTAPVAPSCGSSCPGTGGCGSILGCLVARPCRQKAVRGCPVLVARDHHASVAGRHLLRLLVAEAADVAHSAGQVPFVAGKVGLSAVLDDPQVAPPRQGQDRVEVSRLAEEVDDDHGARLGADLPLDGFSGDVRGA